MFRKQESTFFATENLSCFHVTASTGGGLSWSFVSTSGPVKQETDTRNFMVKDTRNCAISLFIDSYKHAPHCRRIIIDVNFTVLQWPKIWQSLCPLHTVLCIIGGKTYENKTQTIKKYI